MTARGRIGCRLMSDSRPLTKIQWAVIIVAALAFLVSLSKCSSSNAPSSHPLFSAPPPPSTSPKREISPEQREKIKTLLAPYAGSRITTVATVGDEESLAFGAQLDSVFREAGWQTEVQSA